LRFDTRNYVIPSGRAQKVLYLKKRETVNTTVAIKFYIEEVNFIIIGRSRDLRWRKLNEF